MKYHPVFDPEEWLAHHPLRKESQKKSTSFSSISSPDSVAACYKFRKKLKSKGAPLAEPVPVDLCVWNWGDAGRLTTKFGGVPFWPKRCRWPKVSDLFSHKKDNDPLTFIGQVCFADSRDLLPDLPGDILVLLSCWKNFANTVGFWFDLDDGPLLPVNKIPKSEWRITPLHASLYRTVEYHSRNVPDDWLSERNLSDSITLFHHINSSKIGGICPDIGAEYGFDDEGIDKEKIIQAIDDRLQKRYLATLFTPGGPYQDYPYIGLSDGEEVSQSEQEGVVMIADCGGMSLYRDGDRVEVNVSSG